MIDDGVLANSKGLSSEISRAGRAAVPTGKLTGASVALKGLLAMTWAALAV